MIILKRHQLFLMGVAVISLFYILNKTWFLVGTATTTGICTEYDVIYPEGKTKDPDRFFPIIEFKVDDKNYKFTGIENLKFEEGQVIPVIYKKSDPSNAYEFSFFGFWYYGILYAALSTILLTIICYGAFEKNHNIRIRVPFLKYTTLPGAKNKEEKSTDLHK